MNEHEDFNQPGINLIEAWLLNDLKIVDPRSEFAWITKENGYVSKRWVSRKEYIRLLIIEIAKNKK